MKKVSKNKCRHWFDVIYSSQDFEEKVTYFMVICRWCGKIRNIKTKH